MSGYSLPGSCVDDSPVPRLLEDGCEIVRGAVDPDGIAAMREVFDTLVPESAYPAGPTGVLRELTGLARSYPPLAAIARDPRFGRLAAEALGAERVQLLQDALLYKPARDGAPVEWHQDFTYIGYLVPARVVAVRIALLAEDHGNGCMRVVLGSHHWGPLGMDRSIAATSVDSLVPALSGDQRAALEQARPIELAPGDVSIHHVLAVHGSGPNRSDRPRRTIILRMFDGDCRLDRSRLPPGADAYFPTDADGLLDRTAFPLVHGSHV